MITKNDEQLISLHKTNDVSESTQYPLEILNRNGEGGRILEKILIELETADRPLAWSDHSDHGWDRY